MPMHPAYKNYEITEDGRVFRHYKTRKPREMTRFTQYNGYQYTFINHNGERTTCYVHRLVLEASVGLCPEGMEAAHLDGNRQNNHISNLIWATKRENHAHKKLHGTWQGGENNPMALLKNKDIAEIRKLIQSGVKHREIAKMFGVSEFVISSIKRKRSYANV